MSSNKKERLSFSADKNAFIAFVDRVTDGKYGKFVRFIKKESESGLDEYILKCKDGIIQIQATSGSAGGSALNAYLKKYCHYYFGILTKSGTLPDLPPETEVDMVEASVFKYRYAFNYCTFGYSYAFNTWEDWERITDYLILSGYNLVLNPIGNECVWIELLQHFGYTREEARKYISVPNYLPWQWMMNLSAFEGKCPDHWFEEQQVISRKFNSKLKSFGIQAVMPGYCGAVPDDFKIKNQGVTILEQGFWQGFVRPAILLPENQLFFDIAKTYYQLQKELLGAEDMHFYSIDPFHEGGKKEGVNMNVYATAVLKAMKEVDESAVWVLQGWNGNPDRRILSSLHKEDVLILNLHADVSPDGGDDFLGNPHIYCVVNNFGGEQAMRGSAVKTYELPHKMAQDINSACAGIGTIPEGVECDEILFDIISEVAIRKKLRTQEDFLLEYIAARYGFVSDELVKVYKILFEKIYISDIVAYPHESGLLACPSLTVNRVCHWAGKTIVEDNNHLFECIKILLKYYEQCKNSQSYIKDLVGILRQTIGNESWRYIYSLNEALINKDKVAFEKNVETLMRLFELQEQVVYCDPDLRLQKYLDKATDRGWTEEEKKWLVRNSKLLITFWIDTEKGRYVHDYSPREYPEMLRYFYRPRWEKYIENARKALEENTDIQSYDRFKYDLVFLNEDKNYTFDLETNIQKIGIMVLNYFFDVN